MNWYLILLVFLYLNNSDISEPSMNQETTVLRGQIQGWSFYANGKALFPSYEMLK